MTIICNTYQALRYTCIFLIVLCAATACSDRQSAASRPSYSSPGKMPEPPAVEFPSSGSESQPVAGVAPQTRDIYELARAVVQSRASNTLYEIKPEPDPVFGYDNIEEFRRAFRKRIVQSESLEKQFREFTAADIDSMYHQEQKPALRYWNTAMFEHTGTDTTFWYRISLPLFSRDKQRAVMKISTLCPGLCGNGELLVFYKKRKLGTATEWSIQIAETWLH